MNTNQLAKIPNYFFPFFVSYFMKISCIKYSMKILNFDMLEFVDDATV